MSLAILVGVSYYCGIILIWSANSASLSLVLSEIRVPNFVSSVDVAHDDTGSILVNYQFCNKELGSIQTVPSLMFVVREWI